VDTGDDLHDAVRIPIGQRGFEIGFDLGGSEWGSRKGAR
jgi:hypothetical protein